MQLSSIHKTWPNHRISQDHLRTDITTSNLSLVTGKLEPGTDFYFRPGLCSRPFVCSSIHGNPLPSQIKEAYIRRIIIVVVGVKN